MGRGSLRLHRRGVPRGGRSGYPGLYRGAKAGGGVTNQRTDMGVPKVTLVDQYGAVINGLAATPDTELPAAAALADDTVNPTVPAVGALIHGFDGTTWDRIRALVPADALANPSAGALAALGLLMGFNGTTWDRLSA